MSYDPRTIAWISEVIFPPLELRAQLVQAIHNDLYAHPRFSYQNFAVTAGGIQLSNLPLRPGHVSTLTITPDRLQLREELTGATIEEFKERISIVVARAQQKLMFPVAAAHQCTVRSLVNPRHFTDSRDFLARGMARIDAESLVAFGRPAGALGFKLFFPQTADQANYFALRIESFNEDPRSVFLENIGTFTQTPMPAGIPALSEQLQQTYDFLLGSTCDFLMRFDAVAP